MKKHAILSASGASRWINCPPSARLEETFPESKSSFADEGTLAHAFAENELTALYFKDRPLRPEKDFTSSLLYSEEMPGEVEKYIDYVKESYTTGLIFIEQRVNLSKFIEEGFGTCDCVIIADGQMQIIDLKYGKGVRVDAKDNSQLKLYALGAYSEFSLLYDIQTVKLSIVQPRLDYISEAVYPISELMDWAEKVVKPAAALAYAGKGKHTPGSWCKFCRAKVKCKAVAKQAQDAAKLDFAPSEMFMLSDDEVLEVFKRLDFIRDWLNAVETFVTDEAIKGKLWPGYKLVEGRSNRKWSDEEKAAETLRINGYKDYLNTKLKGIGDIEKLVGKANFNPLLSKFVVKPQGAPVLAPENDKRPALNAANDFKD